MSFYVLEPCLLNKAARCCVLLTGVSKLQTAHFSVLFFQSLGVLFDLLASAEILFAFLGLTINKHLYLHVYDMEIYFHVFIHFYNFPLTGQMYYFSIVIHCTSFIPSISVPHNLAAFVSRIKTFLMFWPLKEKVSSIMHWFLVLYWFSWPLR